MTLLPWCAPMSERSLFRMITILMWQSVPADPDALRQRFKTLVQRAIVE
jgi:hypothetical protein